MCVSPTSSRGGYNVASYNTIFIEHLEQFHVQNHQEFLLVNSQKHMKLQTATEALQDMC